MECAKPTLPLAKLLSRAGTMVSRKEVLTMPIRIHCEAAINELDCSRDLSQDMRAWVEHGAMCYDTFDTHRDRREFWCPRCKYIIARNEKDALVFLTATPATE